MCVCVSVFVCVAVIRSVMFLLSTLIVTPVSLRQIKLKQTNRKKKFTIVTKHYQRVLWFQKVVTLTNENKLGRRGETYHFLHKRE